MTEKATTALSALQWGNNEENPQAPLALARAMHQQALQSQAGACREEAAERCAAAARAAVLRRDPPEAVAASVLAALAAPIEPPAIYSTGSRSTFGFEPSHRGA